LTAGDVIAYYHPIYVCGDPRAYRTTIIQEVDPEKEVVLTLDNGEHLLRDCSVKRLQYVQGGRMVCVKDPIFQRIGDYKLQYSITKDYAQIGKTAYSKSISKIMSESNKRCMEIAKQNNVPKDLLHGYSKCKKVAKSNEVPDVPVRKKVKNKCSKA
jgi:hypothetical protein